MTTTTMTSRSNVIDARHRFAEKRSGDLYKALQKCLEMEAKETERQFISALHDSFHAPWRIE